MRRVTLFVNGTSHNGKVCMLYLLFFKYRIKDCWKNSMLLHSWLLLSGGGCLWNSSWSTVSCKHKIWIKSCQHIQWERRSYRWYSAHQVSNNCNSLMCIYINIIMNKNINIWCYICLQRWWCLVYIGWRPFCRWVCKYNIGLISDLFSIVFIRLHWIMMSHRSTK